MSWAPAGARGLCQPVQAGGGRAGSRTQCWAAKEAPGDCSIAGADAERVSARRAGQVGAMVAPTQFPFLWIFCRFFF